MNQSTDRDQYYKYLNESIYFVYLHTANATTTNVYLHLLTHVLKIHDWKINRNREVTYIHKKPRVLDKTYWTEA